MWMMGATHRFIWDDNSEKRMEVRGCFHENTVLAVGNSKHAWRWNVDVEPQC